jgi:hypothetical protein
LRGLADAGAGGVEAVGGVDVAGYCGSWDWISGLFFVFVCVCDGGGTGEGWGGVRYLPGWQSRLATPRTSTEQQRGVKTVEQGLMGVGVGSSQSQSGSSVVSGRWAEVVEVVKVVDVVWMDGVVVGISFEVVVVVGISFGVVVVVGTFIVVVVVGTSWEVVVVGTFLEVVVVG